MHYQSETIAIILERLNRNYFLPAIQREYVWHPDQIIQLFDSLMRNYPISSFLFWQLSSENHDKWEIYEFIQNFHQAGTHNISASPNGVQQLTLVLDGQQRLTSLLIGLKGTYTIKKKYLSWDNPNAWVKQSLYLNLLKDPKATDDDTEEGIRYDFRFMDKVPLADNTNYWFRVGHILNFSSQDKFQTYLDQEIDNLPDTLTKGQVKVFRNNLTRLHDAIWKDYFIAYYTEHDQNDDRVLTIFVRANQGGTKLSKSDLLLSIATAKWDGINARDEIYDFVDRLNSDLSRKNDFDKDFIMKTCLVLSDLPVQYKVENFNNKNLMLIYNKWKSIKAAIEATINLVNSFGIDRDTLTSANALIPIAYYIHKQRLTTLLGSTSFETRNASYIRLWLLTVLLNNTFSGQSDRALTDTRRILVEQAQQEKDFPLDAVNIGLRRSGRKAGFDDDTIEDILSISYGESSVFLALSLLYDDNNWGSIGYHQDHIFPKALFNAKNMTSCGISPVQQKRFLDLVNSVANLQLLLPHENIQKSGQPFEKWLTTRDITFRKRHLIPDDNSLLIFENFEKFIIAREELLRKRFKQVLTVVSSY